MSEQDKSPKIDIDGKEVRLHDLEVLNDKRMGVYALVLSERIPLSEDTLNRMHEQINNLVEERQRKN